MASPKEKKTDDASFDGVLRRMLGTPPDHKPKTKIGVPKKLKKPAK
jgi:hypothetical protein